MGGLVSGIGDAIGGAVNGIGDAVGNVAQAAAPYAGLIGGAFGGPMGAMAGSMLGGAVQGSQRPVYNTSTGQYSYPNVGSAFGSGLQGLAGLNQMQVSKEAAQNAQNQYFNAANTASQMGQFRPVGTTTTFGTSNFQYDPTTGQLTSAGYNLTPQAQAIQDQLMAGNRQSLTDAASTQALGRGYLGGNLGTPLTNMGQNYMASQAGQPLTSMGQGYMASQVGQPLTALGSQYLAQSPQAAAQDWMSKQQALLQPGNEQALAKVKNQLAQTGRTGLSTAQGGALGAANPEMQAYYNSLAQQNAGLASQAQQQGQNAAQFGANLYGQGTGLTQAQQLAGAGLYSQGTGLTQAQQLAGAGLYGQGQQLGMAGQQFGQGLLSSAYNPLTAGLGAASTLESLGQQPLTIGAQLGQYGAQAGANQGRLYGDLQSKGIATGLLPEMTASQASYALGGLGSSPQFMNGIGNAVGGLFGSPFTGGATSNVDFGTQLAGLGNTGDYGLMW